MLQITGIRMASIWGRGLTVPGVFSISKNLQPRVLGTWRYKELYPWYRWEDEEQKRIRCLAGRQAKLLPRAAQPSAQCHRHGLILPALAERQGKTRNNFWDTPRNMSGCRPAHLSQLSYFFTVFTLHVTPSHMCASSDSQRVKHCDHSHVTLGKSSILG